MNERIKPDYSIPLHIDGSEEAEYLLDPRFDHIRLFPWLGYGIINIITQNGVNRLYVDEETCVRINERGGIPLVRLEWIVESEHEHMIEVMSQDLENWLDD